MKKIIITILCIFVIAFIGYLIHSSFSNAKVVARESAQRALFVEAIRLLDEYFKTNGKYPDRLNELPLTYPDGGDQSILNDFDYNTDGTSYKLQTIGYHSKKILKEKKERPNKTNSQDVVPPPEI